MLREIFNSLSFPVMLIDAEYRVVEFNRTAEQHLSRFGGLASGQRCYRATHGLNAPCWHTEEIRCPVKDAFETRKRARAIHKHKVDGRLLVEEIVATPLSKDGGDVQYVLEEFRDVTELLGLRDGILKVCAACRKVKNEDGVWQDIETYIHTHTMADFSHSLCLECIRELYPELDVDSEDLPESD